MAVVSRVNFSTTREYRTAHMRESRRLRHAEILENEKRCRTLARERMGEDAWKRQVKGYNLKKYGITVVEYDAMFIRQGGSCAICEGPPGSVKGFHVDHDHQTNEVRGLLCHTCNQGMIAVDRVTEWPEKAARYKAQFGGA